MDLHKTLDELLNNLEGNLSPSKLSDIELYVDGVRIKIMESQIALENIKSLGRVGYGDTTDKISTIEHHMQFYVDSFFAFLYSSLDVLAQVINIRYGLNGAEKDVSFKGTVRKFDTENINQDLRVILKKIRNSLYFKNLDNYRNCSTHRREICLKTVNNQISRSYKKYAKDLNSVEIFICDNPLSLRPTFKQNRELIDYSEKMFDKVINNLMCLIKKLG